jgi:HAMP domain-containing protein
MGLRAKFNLVLLAAFIVGLVLAAGVSYRIINENARREVVHEAAIIIAQATAVRGYTVNEIRPLLAEQMKRRFLPHTVPSWAAQTTLRAMTAQFPDYAYKEAALNPTNTADRASDWEADIIAEFQRSAAVKEYTVTRDTSSGPILSVAKPIRITDKDCLSCHTNPAMAPATMVDLYGGNNGYGWQLGDVIGAQIVSVPMRVALDRADQLFLFYLGGLSAVFAVTLLLLNLVLHYVIIRPIRWMSAIAEQVSLGDNDAPVFTATGRDEIASLAQSFNRMRRSLVNAMQLLEP